jgi:signal peptidase II
MTRTPNARILLAGILVLVLDQLSKLAVRNLLDFQQEVVVIDGFFKFVHWGNTGAAWSLFRDNNTTLKVISLAALLGLIAGRKFFDTHTRAGDFAMGMIFGGIIGNILDRFLLNHVVDFLYFYLYRRSGQELGFPAFNVADSAICLGVLALFILSLRMEEPVAPKPDSPASQPS